MKDLLKYSFCLLLVSIPSFLILALPAILLQEEDIEEDYSPLFQSRVNYYSDDTYSNQYFSIKYPFGYEAYANFAYCPIGGEELMNMDADSIAAMPMHELNELNIVPKTDNAEWLLPEVYIVLSRHKLNIPIRMFMDLSIYTKEQQGDDNMPLIGYSDVDSISFAGYPALEIEFAYKGESGDTLVQHQIIVQKPDYSLYYLNIKFNNSLSESYELGKKILSSFKFKD